MAFETQFTVRDLIVHNISVISGFPEKRINDSDRLRWDLKMTAVQREALAPGFQKIARQFKPEAIVLRDDCGDLDTVEDSIKLVCKSAGGVKPSTPVHPPKYLVAAAEDRS